MLSMIQVNCPHCQAKGQVMVPPIGSLVVGPCPHCKGLLAVFCGSALPLDKDVFEYGSHEDRKEHLMSVLVSFLASRIEPVIDQIEQDGSIRFNQEGAEPSGMAPHHSDGQDDDAHPFAEYDDNTDESPSITNEEFHRFRTSEIDRIDNPEEFRRIFGSSGGQG